MEGLQNRLRDARGDRSVQDEPRGEPLPGGEGTINGDGVHIDAVLRIDDLGRSNRGGFWRDGAEITAHAEAVMQGILGDGKRAERANPRAHFLQFLE